MAISNSSFDTINRRPSHSINIVDFGSSLSFLEYSGTIKPPDTILDFIFKNWQEYQM